MAQGYNKIEGVYFDETVVPIAHLEDIRLLLGISFIIKFKLYQMDVKSSFLNGFVNEEGYVEKTKGFIDPSSTDHVYKLKKSPYGLKWTLGAWYERITKFITSNGYVRKRIDKILFVKKEGGKLIISQIYVDDIVFRGVTSKMVDHFVQLCNLILK